MAKATKKTTKKVAKKSAKKAASKKQPKAVTAGPLSGIVAPKLLKYLEAHGQTEAVCKKAAKVLSENLETFKITDLPTKGRGVTQDSFTEAVGKLVQHWTKRLPERPKTATRALKALKVAVDRLQRQQELAS